MDARSSFSFSSPPDSIVPAIDTLHQAAEYASDTHCDAWEFAVSIQELIDLGLTRNDLRWLIKKEWVDHARETTITGDDSRTFRFIGRATFSKRTCFVLTGKGREVARVSQRSGACPLVDCGNDGGLYQGVLPIWDRDNRKLRWNGQIVKQFRWPALNQEAVLNAFQEEGWPERVDDPLSPQPEQDSKRRLADTIKCLNKNQLSSLIRFRGDGTGEGVMWELTDSS